MRTLKSQSGWTLRFASVHVRVTVVEMRDSGFVRAPVMEMPSAAHQVLSGVDLHGRLAVPAAEMDVTAESPGHGPRSLGVSAGAMVTRAKVTSITLTWDMVVTLSDDALERTLYGPMLALTVARRVPDRVWMHTELQRPGVTLELLHLEYLAVHPDECRYSAFCGHYRRWRLSATALCRLLIGAGSASVRTEEQDDLTAVVQPRGP